MIMPRMILRNRMDSSWLTCLLTVGQTNKSDNSIHIDVTSSEITVTVSDWDERKCRFPCWGKN